MVIPLRTALSRTTLPRATPTLLTISIHPPTRHLITTPPPPANPQKSSSDNQNSESSTNPAPHTPPTDEHANDAPRVNAESRQHDPARAKQSNASREEGKSGSEHPAKQGDYQEQPERGTGIEGVGRGE